MNNVGLLPANEAEDAEKILRQIFDDDDDDDDDGPDDDSRNRLQPGQTTADALYDVTKSHFSQWQVGPFGTFRPATKTVTALPAGAYTIEEDRGGLFLSSHPLLSDDIVLLPDSANTQVLASIRKFWSVRDRYQRHGMLFKRGILLYGPPGSGKTISITLLVKDLIENDGIVLYCSVPRRLQDMLGSVRRIEPERPLIVVLEDIDEILKQWGEHEILSMLDGEHQTNNCVFVATTNYIDQLAARIVNRPSRFDERIRVGMPSAATRLAYLQQAVKPEIITDEQLTQWVADTDGFSIAHLRELIASVFCLDQQYAEVLQRLRAMTRRPKGKDLEEGFAGQSMGLTGKD